MAELNGRNETELVLAPNEHAFVQDKTKGNINVMTGPNKTSLSTSDAPVIFDTAKKRFVRVDLERAISQNVTSPKGWYIVLMNPAKDNKQPATGSNVSLQADTLVIGNKVNIPGPASFALWPGQIARVVRGHSLRSNQYLVARVYDHEAAKANWSKAVINKAETSGEEVKETETTALADFDPTKFVTGQILIIKGTDVSFYIPPTGISIEYDSNNEYIRDAVTLESLEYCILKDEDGNKRYVHGPNVVFPVPTEQFLSKDGTRKFRAYELNEQTGIYVKVIEDYTEGEGENAKHFKSGQELFITGKDQAIYFPCAQHAIIKYGDQEKHFAIAIPKGEARYVLERDSGNVKTLRGPAMFLPDPRNEVIVRRILEDKECALLYPGNEEAMAYNQSLRESRVGFTSYVESMKFSNSRSFDPMSYASAAASLSDSVDNSTFTKTLRGASSGGSLNRGTAYTPPRTLTLDNKYEGAVTVNVYSGYAVQVVNKSGDRRVVEGPVTLLLEYDEYLEAMSLSCGRPKTADKLISTAYLRVLNNRVGDIIEAVSEDLIGIRIDLKYLVRFTGDSKQWFAVDNYVQYLSHHMRSLIINAVRKQKAADFYVHGTDIIRNLILGTKEGGNKARGGRVFEENGMEIYEVEVLDVAITNAEVSTLLKDSHFKALRGNINVQNSQRDLANTTMIEEANRGIQEQTRISKEAAITNQSNLESLQLELKGALADAVFQQNLLAEQHATELEASELARKMKNQEYDMVVAANKQKIRDAEAQGRIALLIAEADAFVKKGGVVTPQLVSALTALAQGNYLDNLKELAPLSIVQGTSLEGTMNKLFAGTPLEQFGNNLKALGLNASQTSHTMPSIE